MFENGLSLFSIRPDLTVPDASSKSVSPECRQHNKPPRKHAKLNQCWISVADDGPTLNHHWFKVSFLPVSQLVIVGPASQTMALH